MEYPDTPIVQRYVILTGDSTLPLAVNVSVSNCVYVHCSLIGWGQVKLNEGHVIELTSQERSFLIITPPMAGYSVMFSIIIQLHCAITGEPGA